MTINRVPRPSVHLRGFLSSPFAQLSPYICALLLLLVFFRNWRRVFYIRRSYYAIPPARSRITIRRRTHKIPQRLLTCGKGRTPTVWILSSPRTRIKTTTNTEIKKKRVEKAKVFSSARSTSGRALLARAFSDVISRVEFYDSRVPFSKRKKKSLGKEEKNWVGPFYLYLYTVKIACALSIWWWIVVVSARSDIST